MTADPTRRRAALIATIVAVPVALIAGLTSFWLLGAFDRGEPPVGRPIASSPARSSPAAPATGPVSIPAIPLDERAAAVCRAVLSELPEAVREARRRPVTAGAGHNAAYGDPPLTLACGTNPPAVAPTDRVYLLDGVCWHPRPAGPGTAWTTVDRAIPVTVTVPGGAAASGQWVIPFSGPVGAADPPLAPPPTECR